MKDLARYGVFAPVVWLGVCRVYLMVFGFYLAEFGLTITLGE
jgi:hypothetical protein